MIKVFDQEYVGGNYDYNWDSIDLNTFNDPVPNAANSYTELPPVYKTSSYTREEEEKKACPNPDNYWDPGPGKKKICKIDRTDYLSMGAPVYPCDLSCPTNPKQTQFACCRNDPHDGNLGKEQTIALTNTYLFQMTARQQERAVCSKLAHKGYEPPWQTLEVETVDDWWGIMFIKGGMENNVFLDGKIGFISKL